MIKLRNYDSKTMRYDEIDVKFTVFPDNTPYLNFGDIDKFLKFPVFKNHITIFWYYQNMQEFFNIQLLIDKLNEAAKNLIVLDLAISYLPNARMDRIQNPVQDVFTLKTFCKILNTMHFNQIYIMDPHSNVSEALINNYNKDFTISSIETALFRTIIDSEPEIIIYPDAGSEKRYSSVIRNMLNQKDVFHFKGLENEYLKFTNLLPKIVNGIGKKHREWTTGNIKEVVVDFYNANGDMIDINSIDPNIEHKVLIIDDICSKGGTFYYLIKAIEDMNKNNLKFKYDLYVSHLEPAFLDGDLYKQNMLNKVYTTDSLKYMDNSPMSSSNLSVSIKEIFRMEEASI